MYDIFSMKDFSFPDDFFFGSGYAGHQVEGNNTNNNIWREEQEGKFEHLSGKACNSYELYREDIDLAVSLGHQAFRTSVEWCRVEPDCGTFSIDATEHYVDLFRYAKEKGLKTCATMVHFTWPLWFDKINHFEDLENRKYFERYLEHMVPKLAPYVDYWNVCNEFNYYGFRKNFVRFHALGYHIIKKYSSAPVSSAHALVHYMPYRPYDKLDQILTQELDFKYHEFFFHALRTGEILQPYEDGIYDPDVKGAADFWSVNYYTREMIDSRKENPLANRYEHKKLKLINKDFYLEEMHPEIIFAHLSRLTDKPVLITENGVCCDDDRQRIVYLALYLSALAEAIKAGADVKGYLHWSLMDNYEWGSYTPRFGLCDCNFETFERTPKPSAYFYKEIIENKGMTQDILRKYLDVLPSLGKKY